MTAALIIFIALTISLFLVSVLCSRNEDGKRFDFLTEFPFEYINKKERLAVTTRLTFFASLVVSGLWMIFQFFVSSHSETLGKMSFVVYMFYLVLISSIFILSLVNPSYEKGHNFLFVTSGACLILSSGIQGFYLMKVSESAVQTIFAIICFVIAVAALLILVNPKLQNWPKLDAIAEKDGTVSYKRPRPFVLAASEWAIIALTFLLSIVSSLAIIVILNK